MRKEKEKNTFAVMKPLPFLALWTFGHGGAWIFTLWLYLALESTWTLDASNEALFFGFVPGMLAAVVQILLVERGLKKSMCGWSLLSLAGALIAAFGYSVYINPPTYGDNVYVVLGSLLLPFALGQTLWLWRRVKNAWLWLLGALVSVALFVLPIGMIQTDGPPQFILVGLAGILQGIVTGSIMRHLWLQPGEKSKNDTALESQSGDTERLERLQDPAAEIETGSYEPSSQKAGR